MDLGALLARMTLDDPISVQVRVTNTGDRAAVDAVQLFARDEVARVARPKRQLVGFARVELGPGKNRTVRFAVDPTAFAYDDEAMRLVIEPGAVRFSCGDLTATVDIDGPEREIAPNDRRPATVSVSA